MLSVYLSLFGARFLPLLIAAVTTLMIAAAAVWMKCRTRQPGSPCGRPRKDKTYSSNA